MSLRSPTTNTHAWSRWIAERPSSEPVSDRGGTAPSTGLVGARYQIINEIGRGGFGSVYRVVDRLTGRVVTVKRLHLDAGEGDSDDRGALRSSLAQEFRLLASLRHPNIISVLDYGFDENQEPYLAMDLEENARNIVEAGVNQPLAIQVDLLAQALRALLYLHRRGIVHRDLKPDNILVVGGQVKVLDFGLSLHVTPGSPLDADWAGTPAYMAPEILRGEPPSERSDLFALGMIGYEIFLGRHPLPLDSLFALQKALEETSLPRAEDSIDPRLRPVLERLLDRNVETRHHDAGAVIAELGEAVGSPLSAETVATRESLLQTAPHVGRDEELATLGEALESAVAGKGATWLVAGESGVGKSRLLEELRARALVEAVVVVRGQAVEHGGSPFHVWRDVIANLVLSSDPSRPDAEVLKAVVPEIGRLLGRDVGDAPEVDAESAQTRLRFAVETLFRTQPRPLLVLLEDIHWAGSESTALLEWLTQSVARLSTLVVASFRNEEAPELASQVPEARTLSLRRLSNQAGADLAEAMIGAAARRPEVRSFLEREAEGIPFFIVEVMRALGESLGALGRIGDAALPERILSGGIERVVRRRLERLPAEVIPALETAAIVGREIDPAVLGAAHPGLAFDAWAATCERSAVLELQDARWRFSHDKLRERIVEDLAAERRQRLHRIAAEAIEVVHPDADKQLAALAVHWRHAGDVEREAKYAYGAGSLALRSGAFREAVGFLERALDLAGERDAPPERERPRRRKRWLDPNSRVDPDDPAFHLGQIEASLSEAHYRLGDMGACQKHSESSLGHFGHVVPTTDFQWMKAAASEALVRGLQSAFKTRAEHPESARRVAAEAARAQLRLTDVYFYSLRSLPIVWSSLRTVNQCEPAGPSAELAEAYVILAVVAGTARARRLGDAWAKRAVEIAERVAVPRNVAWVQSRVAAYQIPEGRWQDVVEAITEATEIAEKVGDLRLWVESRMVTANMGLYTGVYEPSLELLREVRRLSRRSGNRQGEIWALTGEAGNLTRLSRDDEAAAVNEEALRLIDHPEAMKTEVLCHRSVAAVGGLRRGDLSAAFEAAESGVAVVRDALPVAYWLQVPLAFVVEVLLALVERGWEPPAGRPALVALAHEAVSALRRFARQLPLARPHATLWHGLEEWLAGRPRRATGRWKAALALADRMGTPYEGACARYELGRHLSPDDPARSENLEAAASEFERLGCVAELGRARAVLGGGVPPVGGHP